MTADAPSPSPSSLPGAPSSSPVPPSPLTHIGDNRFVIQDGQPIVLVGSDGKKLMIKAEAGKSRGTHHGEIDLSELVGKPLGCIVYSRKGVAFHALRPTLEDFVMSVKRATQIVYPKDIGPILMKLGLFPGAHVIECGSGSGSLTTALAWSVSPGGRVESYDRKEAHQAKAQANINKVGLGEAVRFHQRDVTTDGFEPGFVDAVFLDLKDAAWAVPHVAKVLHPGCMLGALVPTMNQVSDVLKALDCDLFTDFEVLETFQRNYKLNPARMRPNDRMVAHTSYLIFARRVTPPPSETPPDEGTATDDAPDPT